MASRHSYRAITIPRSNPKGAITITLSRNLETQQQVASNPKEEMI